MNISEIHAQMRFIAAHLAARQHRAPEGTR